MKALTLLTSGLMVFIGVALIVRTVDAGGGATALGILLGVLFVAAGAGRLFIARGGEREGEDDR
jgi:hypothetical protein